MSKDNTEMDESILGV